MNLRGSVSAISVWPMRQARLRSLKRPEGSHEETLVGLRLQILVMSNAE
jgi:hypothetical protein